MDGTARVLVTNYLNFLDRADKIVVFDKQAPVFVGTYDELKASQIDLAHFVVEHKDESDESTQATDDDSQLMETKTTTTTTSTPTPTPEQSKPSSGTVCDSISTSHDTFLPFITHLTM